MNIAILLIFALLTLTLARPEYRGLVPNGIASDRPGSGITCSRLGHNGCISGAPRNQFGLDFMAAGFRWTKALCMKDSDGDGLTNGEELGDPCCLWTPSNGSPLRLTKLSHPGDATQKGAGSAPGCTMPNLPNPVGKCRNEKDRNAVACVCFAIFTRVITVSGRNRLLAKCGMLLETTKNKLRMFDFACGRFRNRRGKLILRKLMRKLSVLTKCMV